MGMLCRSGEQWGADAIGPGPSAFTLTFHGIEEAAFPAADTAHGGRQHPSQNHIMVGAGRTLGSSGSTERERGAESSQAEHKLSDAQFSAERDVSVGIFQVLLLEI